MDLEDAKRAAARAAVDELPPRGVIGLGTGSTAKYFVEEVAARVRAGHEYVGVPTSRSTAELAASLGVPLLDDVGPWDIEVTVDGADEVDDRLDLIKGGGGAHTREKIVAAASRRLVIVVDATKVSTRLGERWHVPVEVLPFGHGQTAKLLAAIGKPTLRMKGDAPVRTDSGNLIYDVAAGILPDPAATDRALLAIPGVVETGLFVGRASVVLVASEKGVTRLTRK